MLHYGFNLVMWHECEPVMEAVVRPFAQGLFLRRTFISSWGLFHKMLQACHLNLTWPCLKLPLRIGLLRMVVKRFLCLLQEPKREHDQFPKWKKKTNNEIAQAVLGRSLLMSRCCPSLWPRTAEAAVQMLIMMSMLWLRHSSTLSVTAKRFRRVLRQ